MGTHSTIHIYNMRGKNLVNIYTQYDGDYQSVGKMIYEWWKNKENYGNGFEDTAFLFIANYKGNSAYNKYLTTENDEEEYNYYIYEDKEEGVIFKIKKEVWLEDKGMCAMVTTLRGGNIDEFLEVLNTEKEFTSN